jgi:hypothetical protein
VAPPRLVTSVHFPVSYRAYHDYNDDRDVITCVTLSDTRPVARKEHTCGGCK